MRSLARPAPSRPTHLRFAPGDPELSPDQIAMNPAKMREIRAALGNRLVVVSGPAGCSKTAAVRALIREARRPVREYVERGHESASSRADSFGEFLVGCALAPPDTVVLVDELPNLGHGPTLEKFREAVGYWAGLERAGTLLIIFTETEHGSGYGEMLLVSRVFGALLEECTHVKCLAISPRFLSKALRAHTTDKRVVEELARLGDIRQALCGLRVSVASKRDLKTSIFHRIGQVVWASKNIDPTLLLDREEYDGQFESHLFENYAECGGASLDLRDLARCSEFQSLGDAYDLGLSSFALYTILRGAPPAGAAAAGAAGAAPAPGRFRACVMSQQRQRGIDAMNRMVRLELELARVREAVPASARDLLLNHSLGLENGRAVEDDIYFSDSD